MVTIIGIGGHDTGLPGHDAGISGHDQPEYPQGYVIVGEEHTTGFIQFTYAALYVSESQLGARKSSPEGSVIPVSLAELEHYILSGHLDAAGQHRENIKMTPSLALALLAWLKIGAPDQHGRAPIKKEAQALYERIRSSIKLRL